jgi:cysteine synthase
VIPVPDAASVAGMRWLRQAGIDAGPAAGTNLWGVCHLAARMRAAGAWGTIVTVGGDSGEAYRHTHLDPDWVRRMGLESERYEEVLARFLSTGEWPG